MNTTYLGNLGCQDLLTGKWWGSDFPVFSGNQAIHIYQGKLVQIGE